MSIIKITKGDVVWSYVGTFFRICTNITLLPIVLKYLTDIELGLWYVFIGISGIVAMLNFGFAPSVARNISYIWCGAKELKKESLVVTKETTVDHKALKIVLKTCELVYLVIAGTALILLITAGTLYINYVGGGDYRISWVIYTIGVFLNMYYSYYTSFLRGVGALAENNKAEIVSRCTQIIVSLFLLLNGYGLLGVSISYLLSGITLRLYSMYAFYSYEGIGKSLRSIRIEHYFAECKKMFLILWHNASKDGLVTLANYLATHANTLICSAVIGLTTTGSYGIAVQFGTIITSFAQIPFTIAHPLLQEKSVTGDLKSSRALFSSSIILYVVLFCIMSLCLIVGMPIISYFKPTFEIDNIMLAVILLYMMIYNMYCLFASYISTFNTLPYTKAFILSSLVSTVVSFLAAKYLNIGIWALIVAPLVVALAYNAWRWPYYVIKKKLGIDLGIFIYEGTQELGNLYKKKIKKQ